MGIVWQLSSFCVTWYPECKYLVCCYPCESIVSVPVSVFSTSHLYLEYFFKSGSFGLGNFKLGFWMLHSCLPELAFATHFLKTVVLFEVLEPLHVLQMWLALSKGISHV